MSLVAMVLASLLAPGSGAEEAAGVHRCAEEIVEGTARRSEDMHAYMQTCIDTWLPPYLGTAAPGLRPSGKAAVTRYFSSGDGASCGPDDDDEGGEVGMRFIVLVPMRGDETVSHVVLKVETVLGFCHEKSRTVLDGVIEKATLIP